MKALPCVTVPSRRVHAFFLNLSLSALAVIGSARAEFFLQQGDRVVSFGDSIIQSMLYTKDI